MKLRDAAALLQIECNALRLSPATLRFYAQQFKKLRPLADRRVQDIDATDLRAVIAAVSDRSAPHVYRYIRRLFSFLTREELLVRNPATKLRPPRISKPLVEGLTSEEIRRCYAAAKASGPYYGLRDATLFAVLVGTGLRRSETCSLRDPEVNLATGSMLVHGKGGKDRLVPVPPRLRLLMARYRIARDECKSAGRSNFFFRSKAGGQLSPEDLYATVRRIGERAGVRLWPHRLRHTFATEYMANEGADVLSLQAIAGWSSTQMAARYAKPSLRKLQVSMDRFSPAADL